MDLIEARNRLENAWSIETTFCPEDYNHHDPAWGQCAVTACRLQELIGGRLLKGWAFCPYGLKTRHYWNEINTVPVDLTWRQFPVGTYLLQIEYATYTDLIQNKWMQNKLDRLRHLTS